MSIPEGKYNSKNHKAGNLPQGILPLNRGRLTYAHMSAHVKNEPTKEEKNRIAGLKRIRDSAFGGKAVALAAKLEIPADYLSRLFTDKKRLSGDMARVYEERLNIPKYTLDNDPSNAIPGPDIRGKLPLISWVIAGDLCESPDNFQPGHAEEWIDCPVPHSTKSYCLRVKGDSMDNGEPDGYRNGEIIFVDPDVMPVPGRDVVVRSPDGSTTFKRLKEDADGLYLLGLNEKKIIRVPEGTNFCGVVIFSGMKR